MAWCYEGDRGWPHDEVIETMSKYAVLMWGIVGSSGRFCDKDGVIDQV